MIVPSLNIILFIGIQQSIFFSSDFVQWRLAFGDERLFKNLPDLINWTSFTKEIVHWEWWALAISEWNIFQWTIVDYIVVNCFFCQLKVLDPCIAAGSALCYMRYSVFYHSWYMYHIYDSFCRIGNMSTIYLKKFWSFTVTKWFNFFLQVFSTSLKIICLLDSKNTFVLVPAFVHLAIVTVFTPNRWFLAIFEVGLEPSSNYACTSVPELMCPSPWKLYIGDFPFFCSPLAHLEPQLELFEVWEIIVLDKKNQSI